MRDQVGQGDGRILLDLQNVEFLDSSGLGAVVALMKLLGQDRGWSLRGSDLQWTRCSGLHGWTPCSRSTKRRYRLCRNGLTRMNQADLAEAEHEVRDYRLKSTPNAVRATLRTLRADLERLGISDDDLNSIELVVAEVLNNVTEHAYPPMRPGRIEMQLVDDSHNLTVTVGDFGIEMPGGSPPEGRAPPGDYAFDRSAGGRVWLVPDPDDFVGPAL